MLPPGFHEKYEIDTTTGCWVWQRAATNKGYGSVRHEGRMQYAHRLTFAHYRDTDLPVWEPGGWTLDHLCRNRACCNPWHMDLVSNRENTLRGTGPTATNAAKTHCPQGHPYEGDNLYVNPRGQRKCRECLREDKRRYYARRRADRAAATAALSEWVTA